MKSRTSPRKREGTGRAPSPLGDFAVTLLGPSWHRSWRDQGHEREAWILGTQRQPLRK